MVDLPATDNVTISKRRACCLSYNDRICNGELLEKWEAAQRDGWRQKPVLSDRSPSYLYRSYQGSIIYLTLDGLLSYKPGMNHWPGSVASFATRHNGLMAT